MSRPTFYLAAASCFARRASEFMAELERLGFVNAMDWVQPLSAHESEWAALAERDIKAAVGADLFVLVNDPESYGAMAEFGARLAVGKPAHVVGVRWHFFMRHDLCRVHDSWEAFVRTALLQYAGKLVQPDGSGA